MQAARKARFDWLVEVAAASALAGAAGFAALKLAPSLALPGPSAMAASGAAFFALGMLVMRKVPVEPPEHSLPEFALDPVEPEELLLDERWEEPLLLDEVHQEDDGALLVEDQLGDPDPASRVVQLFAAQPVPTAGELKERIDRHLAGAPRRAPADLAPAGDASAALFAALDDLRRSLR